jgi:hypothetical protein
VAESSMFWTTTGALGDGADTYGERQAREWLRASITSDRYASEGVLAGNGGSLAVTAGAGSVNVAAGAAYVDGLYYQNTASAALAVPTPSGGTTGHRVVLQADMVGRTVRLALLSAANGVSTPPSVTQQDGTLWEISLATLAITNAGTITVTDARDYAHLVAAPVQRRLGGSSGDWSSSGANTYRPGGQLIQLGAGRLEFDDDDEDSETKSVSFPTSYSARPLVIPVVLRSGITDANKVLVTVYGVEKGSASFRGRRTDDNDWSSDTDVPFLWVAIGPE